MSKDRREKLALDEAFGFFQRSLEQQLILDIYSLAKALKTVSMALDGVREGKYKLTLRLWNRIQSALFDRLVTRYSAHVVVYTADEKALNARQPWPEDGTIEVHPEDLKRADDYFRLPLKQLYPPTRERLEKIWTERGPRIQNDDFTDLLSECNDFCSIEDFVVGGELLREESVTAKLEAYQRWWDLFWQSYGCSDKKEKQDIMQEMSALEQVWGNLNY